MIQNFDLIHVGKMSMTFLQAGFIILIGYFAARTVSILVRKGLTQLAHKKLLERVFFYSIFSLFFVSALTQLGFNLDILLGAAGILTIAIGFASQTSASNFISGLFLVFERIFSEGDVISIEGVTGEVISVDLLSTSLRTADNVLIRLPNEMVIKSKLINLSRFSTRQLELPLFFAYEQNINEIQALWFDIVQENNLCLKNPLPAFSIKSIEKEYVSVICSAWVDSVNYLTLKNELQKKWLTVFEQKKITPYTFHSSLPKEIHDK